MRALIILMILFFLRCAPDAPHKPTLPGSITGDVSTLFGSKPLDGAEVQLFPNQLVDSTDDMGYFAFNLLLSGTYMITISKNQYVEKVETTYIDESENKTMKFELNGKPIVQDYSVYSIHSTNGFEQFKVIFALSLYDMDAFVADSVMAESNNEKLRLTYQNGDTLSFYKKTLIYSDLTTVDTIIGIAFDFWVKDMGGTFSDTVSSELDRVIDKLPQIVYPVSGDSLSLGDTLKWSSPYLWYYTFVILKIWEIGSTIENPEWISDTLQITDSTYVFNAQIKQGTYNWAVEIIDKLNNSSRAIAWFYH